MTSRDSNVIIEMQTTLRSTGFTIGLFSKRTENVNIVKYQATCMYVNQMCLQKFGKKQPNNSLIFSVYIQNLDIRQFISYFFIKSFRLPTLVAFVNVLLSEKDFTLSHLFLSDC